MILAVPAVRDFASNARDDIRVLCDSHASLDHTYDLVTGITDAGRTTLIQALADLLTADKPVLVFDRGGDQLRGDGPKPTLRKPPPLLPRPGLLMWPPRSGPCPLPPPRRPDKKKR